MLQTFPFYRRKHQGSENLTRLSAWLPGHLKLSVAPIRGLHCSHRAAVVQATVMLKFLLSLVFTSCFLWLQVSSSYLQLSNFGDGARWPPRWSLKASGLQGSRTDPWWPRPRVAESRSQGGHGGGHTTDGCLCLVPARCLPPAPFISFSFSLPHSPLTCSGGGQRRDSHEDKRGSPHGPRGSADRLSEPGSRSPASQALPRGSVPGDTQDPTGPGSPPQAHRPLTDACCLKLLFQPQRVGG